MRSGPLLLCLLLAAGCAEIKQAGPQTDIGGGAPPPAGDLENDKRPPLEAGSDTSVGVSVEDLITGRNRLGARSSAGFRPWRSGLAVRDDRLYWVESGTAPGLYAAPVTCATETCVERVATFTRPSAFTSTGTGLYVSDTTVIKRLDFKAGAKVENVATAPGEVVNLVSDGESVFWTADTDQSIRRTTAAGTTSTLIHSNGTPVAMGVAGGRVFWAGVDISGQLGAMQSIGTDGAGAREVSRFSSGFHVMRGNATYLFYAKDAPATVHRVTLATGRDEVVASDGLGVSDFAIDETHLYWVEPGDSSDVSNGQVRRVAHDSKTAETLAVAVPYPVALAVTGKTVFVASAGTKAKAFADGKILKLTMPD